ncbi:hypothetical protein KSP40_PGU018162 [Platanthera guangdongensis]|uniref:Uncharacterized protein n=1 Tax=Platanthera guangdongensis TaxID=2320717 RepID=A0ABR2MKF4_9ASPA
MSTSAFPVSVLRANSSYSSPNLMLSKRFFHPAVSSSFHLLGLVYSMVVGVICHRQFPYVSVRPAAGAGTARLNPIRCRVHRLGGSPYSPINSDSESRFSDKPPTEMALLFPRCDCEQMRMPPRCI